MHVSVKLYIMLQHQNLIMMLFIEKKSTLTTTSPHSKPLTPRHHKALPKTPNHTPLQGTPGAQTLQAGQLRPDRRECIAILEQVDNWPTVAKCTTCHHASCCWCWCWWCSLGT